MVTEQGREGEREERMICTGSRLGERRGGESLPHARARPRTRPHPPPPPPPPPPPRAHRCRSQACPLKGPQRGARRARAPRGSSDDRPPTYRYPRGRGGGGVTTAVQAPPLIWIPPPAAAQNGGAGGGGSKGPRLPPPGGFHPAPPPTQRRVPVEPPPRRGGSGQRTVVDGRECVTHGGRGGIFV